MNKDANQNRLSDVQVKAQELAERLPMVIFEARKVSYSVAHGIHGRKRSGPGDNFWQYRRFQHGDSASQIDWRKSASSNQLYIRQTEWEAAQTIWFWSNLSSSMDFRSDLAPVSKRERALVLMLALGQVMINGGERVGILGHGTPTASRNITEKLAETLWGIISSPDIEISHPPEVTVAPLSECVIFTDCLEPLEDVIASLSGLASQGIRGHLVHIIDPVEETFPFAGRTEFHAAGYADKLMVERAEGVRDSYMARFSALKEELRSSLEMMQWSYLIHHTDRPASEALLALYTMISDASSVGYYNQMIDGEGL